MIFLSDAHIGSGTKNGEKDENDTNMTSRTSNRKGAGDGESESFSSDNSSTPKQGAPIDKKN